MRLSPEQDALIAARKAEFESAQQAVESEQAVIKMKKLGGVDPSSFVNRKARRAHMRKVRTQGSRP